MNTLTSRNLFTLRFLRGLLVGQLLALLALAVVICPAGGIAGAALLGGSMGVAVAALGITNSRLADLCAVTGQ